MKTLLVVIALAAGCGKSKAACKAEVDELMAFLHTLDRQGSPFFIDDSTRLVQRTALPKAVKMAPVVVIQAKRTMYKGMLVDADMLAEQLVATHAKLADDIERGHVSRRDPPDPLLLYFEIDDDAMWDQVASAVRAGANAGFVHASFAFALPATQKPPPRTWVDDKFDEERKRNSKDGGASASGIAKIASGIAEPCPALVKLYGAVGADENEDKATTIIEGTGPALIDCSCKADVPAVRSVMWLILGDIHPAGVIQLDLDKDAKPLALPAATPWRDASKQLVADAKTWFVAT